jgi:hypothetical protein
MGCAPSKHTPPSRVPSSLNIIVKEVTPANTVTNSRKPTVEIDLNSLSDQERKFNDKIAAAPCNMSIKRISTKDYEEAGRLSVALRESIDNQTILASDILENT